MMHNKNSSPRTLFAPSAPANIKNVDYFRLEGSGWQTKIGNALLHWIKKHPHKNSARKSKQN